MPTSVVGNDSKAVVQEEQHLGIPVVSRKRPTVTEYDRIAGSPVLVEDLNAVSGFDRTHVAPCLAQIERSWLGVLPPAPAIHHPLAALPRGVQDQIRDLSRMGDQRQMTGLHFDRLGAHPLGHEALEIGIDRPVLR